MPTSTGRICRECIRTAILFLNFYNTRVATKHLRLAITKDSDAMSRCFEVAIFHDACIKYAGKPLRDMIKSKEIEGVLEKYTVSTLKSGNSN